MTIRDVVDATTVVGDTAKDFAVEPKGKAALDFAVTFGAGTYSALYPVHVYVDFAAPGAVGTAHAVRIVSVKLASDDPTSDQPTDAPLTVIPEGAYPLWTAKARVAWAYYDKPEHYKPAGWAGADTQSRASFAVTTMTRGETRPALSVHPPWQPGGGTLFCDYLVSLPEVKPIELTFGCAIRDNTAQEPASDGVLFRVTASEPPGGANPQVLSETFTKAKQWQDVRVDLSAYAGRTILLRLESDPGPARDTTCDNGFWGAPTILSGENPIPARPSLAEQGERNAQVGRLILAGSSEPDGTYTFAMGPDVVAVCSPTERGIIDGVWTLVGHDSVLSLDGLQVSILDQPAVRAPSALGFAGYEVVERDGRSVHRHHLPMDGRPIDLDVTLFTEGDGLRVAIECAERVTDFALGPADVVAKSVYYGHGYRLDNPKGFSAYFGGHDLATSHVGFDFTSGMSVLQATDVPPDYLEVAPTSRRYALHSHNSGTLTLVAGEKGAFDCALRYRPLYDKIPAGAIERLAGKMCFDIWGGPYSTIADEMRRMIRYGLTDSFLTVHAWQRWGYDYRLPDIWPPLPDLGTVEDMRRIAEVCRAQDIPWGLHDNYIDFYPDAEGYSYKHIAFTADGRPIPAWYNEGRDAQAYRWRSDAFRPFMERNLALIKDGVAPTHYFIDVFTSIGCIDFYDSEGNFHSSLETRQAWGETFAYIRDLLGNAPTTSEAGHDQLTGYLDGADCQHLTLSPKPQEFMVYRECDGWERVPWFDAVNHDRFILHGVGYSGRYEGGRSRAEHGINSDDYISDEILTGHALMVDTGCWGRQAVRKYYLAQDIARSLALRHITGVEMVDGDMHRQAVRWDNGTRVYVNRGEADWTVDGRVLPQYGYLVEGEGLTSAIERRDGAICESTVGTSGHYCDARTFQPDLPIALTPRVEGFTYEGGNRISWDVVWRADQPAPRDARVFVHFLAKRGGRQVIAFQDDHQPPTAPTTWSGEVRYRRTVTIPADAEGDYEVGFGLWDGANRFSLTGPLPPSGGSQVVYVGTLSVGRGNGAVASVRFAPAPLVEPPAPRGNTAKRPIDFGFAVTDGAFRVRTVDGNLELTPLPDGPPFEVTLRLDALGAAGRVVRQVVAVSEDGVGRDVPFSQDGDALTLHHDGKAFAYALR